jgi:hypothetical protein
MSATQEDIARLYAEFPRKAISWRAQSLTRDGSKAMALAYIDARDVMDRLDTVVGPSNWQRNYTHAEKKTICSIGIKIDGEWVWKSDGAGDSDVEAEKGAISDAFKRAAVNWGIARYLYNMPSPWVPCEVSEHNGKKTWKSWKDDPWKFVRGAPEPFTPEVDDKKPADPVIKADSRQQTDANSGQTTSIIEDVKAELKTATTVDDVRKIYESWKFIAKRDRWPKEQWASVVAVINMQAERCTEATDTVADIQDTFPGARVTNEIINHPIAAG